MSLSKLPVRLQTLWFLMLSILPLVVSGCLSHWFLQQEVRLQVENNGDRALHSLSVVSHDTVLANRIWIADTLLPGDRSKVSEGEWVGTFTLGLYEEIPECTGSACWKWVELGPYRIEGGSWIAVLDRDSLGWSLDWK